jgi:hypothetical protein
MNTVMQVVYLNHRAREHTASSASRGPPHQGGKLNRLIDASGPRNQRQLDLVGTIGGQGEQDLGVLSQAVSFRSLFRRAPRTQGSLIELSRSIVSAAGDLVPRWLNHCE